MTYMRFIPILLLAAAVCSACSPSADDLQKDPHGGLIWDARHGDVATMRKLAARGVDLDASSTVDLTFVFPDFDHRGRTALQHAVVKDQVQAVRVLLECGADPERPAVRRDASLHSGREERPDDVPAFARGGCR